MACHFLYNKSRNFLTVPRSAASNEVSLIAKKNAYAKEKRLQFKRYETYTVPKQDFRTAKDKPPIGVRLDLSRPDFYREQTNTTKQTQLSKDQ